jgi:hypothetical protein
LLGLSVVSSLTSVPGASLSAPITYFGMCDASAAVAIGTNLFLVANDEDNILRAYHRYLGGLPIFRYDVTAFLRPVGKSVETDLEGAARIGDRIYWITSHGRNAKGKFSPNRHRFFATSVAVTGETVSLRCVGKFYSGLLGDFALDGRLAPFRLGAASTRAPKAPGALNIEGLTATPENNLLIGFRNPIPGGKALIVPLLNPADLIEGRSAKFGDPVLLDLGGLGVRSMGLANDKYLIIAGPFDNDGVSRLYEWAGGSSVPKLRADVSLRGANPEGIGVVDAAGQQEFFVLSDDGTLKINGQDCKRLKDPNLRRFRGYSLVP